MKIKILTVEKYCVSEIFGVVPGEVKGDTGGGKCGACKNTMRLYGRIIFLELV